MLWNLTSLVLTLLNAVPVRRLHRLTLPYLPSRYMGFRPRAGITVRVPARAIAGEVVMPDGRWWLRPGDWDERKRKPVDRARTYRIMASLAARDELDYHNDPVYRECLSRIETRGHMKVNNGRYLCNRADLDDYYESRCELVRSIRREGVRDAADPVRLAVGRDGELLKVGDGRHRLAVARTLDLPVTGQIRHAHPEWLTRHWPSRRKSVLGALTAIAEEAESLFREDAEDRADRM